MRGGTQLWKSVGIVWTEKCKIKGSTWRERKKVAKYIFKNLLFSGLNIL